MAVLGVEGEDGGGRCEEANEALRSGDEVATMRLEDGATELEDVVGDEVAILVPGSVASNTLLGVDFSTGGYRAGARAGNSYSDYSQDWPTVTTRAIASQDADLPNPHRRRVT